MQGDAAAIALGALVIAVGAVGGGAALGGSSRPSEPATTLAPGGSASPAEARPQSCTRYAAPWGRDGARGTVTRPLRTVQRLANALRPGETGCLRAGTYSDTFDGWVLRVGRRGKPGAPVTIRSYPGERAQLVGIVYVPRGSDNVVLSDLDIEGTGGANTVKIYARDVVLQQSAVTNRGRGESCMMIGSVQGWGTAERTIVRRNRFHECGNMSSQRGHAIYISGAVGTRIVGNVFWSTAGYTIHFFPDARGSYVAFNVIDGDEPSIRGGVLFGGDDDHASSGNVVERNVVAYAQSANITSFWDDPTGTGNIARFNCLWAGRDANIDSEDGGFESYENVVAAPMFVDRDQRDYRLRPRSRCLEVIGKDVATRLGLVG